jgi:hypothetical protein
MAHLSWNDPAAKFSCAKVSPKELGGATTEPCIASFNALQKPSQKASALALSLSIDRASSSASQAINLLFAALCSACNNGTILATFFL